MYVHGCGQYKYRSGPVLTQCSVIRMYLDWPCAMHIFRLSSMYFSIKQIVACNDVMFCVIYIWHVFLCWTLNCCIEGQGYCIYNVLQFPNIINTSMLITPYLHLRHTGFFNSVKLLNLTMIRSYIVRFLRVIISFKPLQSREAFHEQSHIVL